MARKLYTILATVAVAACSPEAGDDGITSIRRTDGSVVRGHLIHVYDFTESMHDPRDEQFYALFDADRWAEDAASDRSIALVSSREVVRIRPDPPRRNVGPFLDFVRMRGFTFERLPFDGVWFVAEDGFNTPGDDSYHEKEGGCGDYAWDLIVLDHDWNEHCQGSVSGCTDGESNPDYYAWMHSIVVPRDGTVRHVFDANYDYPPYTFPPDEESNAVDIELGGGYFITLHHLHQSSATVGVGDDVRAGDAVGVIGNSGQSWAPHLHASLY